MTIAFSKFVRRQTKESRFAHFEGTEQELTHLVDTHWYACSEGYKKGVVLVPVPLDRFYTSIVAVDDGTKLSAGFVARQDGEEKHILVTANGQKQKAASVQIVLYHKDVLAEDNDRSTDADWEIVSINAYPTLTPSPMHPLTMARNFLHKKGGTKGNYTAQQFADAIWFWSRNCGVE